MKWEEFQVIFRKSDGISEPITDVQVPMVFNLIGDPGERFNLWEVSLDMGWVYRPVFEQAEVPAERGEISQHQNRRGF